MAEYRDGYWWADGDTSYPHLTEAAARLAEQDDITSGVIAVDVHVNTEEP